MAGPDFGGFVLHYLRMPSTMWSRRLPPLPSGSRPGAPEADGFHESVLHPSNGSRVLLNNRIGCLPSPVSFRCVPRISIPSPLPLAPANRRLAAHSCIRRRTHQLSMQGEEAQSGLAKRSGSATARSRRDPRGCPSGWRRSRGQCRQLGTPMVDVGPMPAGLTTGAHPAFGCPLWALDPQVIK